MKVKFLGFKIELDGTLTLEELVAFIKDKDPVEFASFDRLVRATKKEGYFQGLVATIKDQRKVLEIQQDSFVISVRALERNKRLVDVNFFVIHTATGRGLYQHYHHSMAIQRFAAFLNWQMRALVAARVEEAIQNSSHSGALTDRQRAAIRKKYRTKVKLIQLVKPEDIEDLIAELSRIAKFSFQVETVTPETKLFAPYSGLVNTQRTELVFQQNVSPAGVKSAVLQLIEKVKPVRGRVVGRNDDGLLQYVDLLHNYESFGELEFDDMASEVRISVDEFHKSGVLKALLKAAKKNATLFETPEAV